jgi:hypothetical protein
MLGTSGSPPERFMVVTASARSFPALICSMDAGKSGRHFYQMVELRGWSVLASNPRWLYLDLRLRNIDVRTRVGIEGGPTRGLMRQHLARVKFAQHVLKPISPAIVLRPSGPFLSHRK